MLDFINTFIQFLGNRKNQLLIRERIAKGSAKRSISDQIQVLETMLVFLNQQKLNLGDIDMEKLNVLLDGQFLSIEEIKARQRKQQDSGLTKEIMIAAELAQKNPNAGGFAINTEKYKGKSIVTKISTMRRTGKLPDYIKTMTAGSAVFLVHKK